MAGIVEAEQSPAIAVDLQTCDPGHGMPKAPEPREVNREDVREEGEDNEVVSDNADCVVGVALSERTDCSGRALLHIDESFAARHSVPRSFVGHPSLEDAGIALSHFAEGEAVEFTDIHFDEQWFDLDCEAVRGGNADHPPQERVCETAAPVLRDDRDHERAE